MVQPCATMESNDHKEIAMTKLDLQAFQTQLTAQRDGLRAQLAALRGGDVGRAEASAEHFGSREDSQAQTTTARELEFALDAHDSQEIAAVEAALQRIAKGTYGECTDCGVHIPAARLHAAPDAARCIACQEKAEHA
jgi:DnaK suppressor protein